jgi:carbon storage regulator
MLVLARRLNESIMIGDDIEVVVIDIKGDQVKLGIKAPKNVPIHRLEIYQEIKQENIAATRSELDPEKLKKLSDLLKKEPSDDTGGEDREGKKNGNKGK